MRYGRACLGIAVGLCLLGGGCDKKAAEPQMDQGRLEGSVYHNDYLGMTITLPSDWSIQDRQTAQQMMRTGEKVMAGDNDNIRATLEAGEARTVNLVTAFKHPYGSPVDYNPSICAVAERVSHLPGLKTGGDYLFHAKRLLQSGQVHFSFPREVYTETVAGAEFHVMTTQLSLLPTKITKQEYFAAIRKGYALLFVLSYSTEEEKAELHNILGTLTFSPGT